MELSAIQKDVLQNNLPTLFVLSNLLCEASLNNGSSLISLKQWQEQLVLMNILIDDITGALSE